MSSTAPGPPDEALTDYFVQAALRDPKINEDGFECSKVFALVHVLLNSPSSPKRRLVKSIGSVYLFVVERPAKEQGGEPVQMRWWVDMKKRGRILKLASGDKPPLKPDVTLWIADKDLVGLASGKLMPQKLFDAKRIKVRGNLDRALQVEKILKQEREKIERAGSLANPPDAVDGTFAGEDGGKKKSGRGGWLFISKKPPRAKL